MALEEDGELGVFAVAFSNKNCALAVLGVTDALPLLDAGGAVGLEATEGKGSSVSWQTSALLVNVQLEVGVTFHIFS